MVVLLSQHARPQFTPYEHGSSPVHPQGKREIAKRCGGGCFDHFLLLWQGSCTRTPQIRLSIRGLWVFYEISDGSLVPPMTCLFDSSDPCVTVPLPTTRLVVFLSNSLFEEIEINVGVLLLFLLLLVVVVLRVQKRCSCCEAEGGGWRGR